MSKCIEVAWPRKLAWIIILACLSLMIGFPWVATAVQLTADQINIVKQLSPADKARLASQVGQFTQSTQGGASASVDSPPVPDATIKVRALERGPIEQAPNEHPLDRKDQIHAVEDVRDGDQSIRQENLPENKRIRTAFVDFVRESKPFTVDTRNLKQFGYALFAGVPSTFAPVTDVPVPADYVLGPGDELKVQLVGAKSGQFTLVIDRNGNVAFPEIGPIALSGLSFVQARSQLDHAIKKKMIGVSPSITMGGLRSIRIFALGEVAQPGSYVVSGLATLSHALMASGGVNKTGSLRQIQLKRAGVLVTTIDLYDFLLKGDTSKDVRLLPGDVVFVPPIGLTAGIAGQVLRPAYYELKSAHATVGELLKLSGGLLPRAYTQKALLERISQKGEKTVLGFSLKGKPLAMKLRSGDLIKVFSVLDFEDNPVALIGNVKRPGKYAWKTGMHLSDLIQNRQALLPETFMDYGLIEREAPGSREPELKRFSINALLDAGAARVNPRLNPRDKVYVFNRSHFRIVPKAEIQGSVKSPGRYVIKKNMHLLDLLMAAGGLTRAADLDEAELYRTRKDTKKVTIQRFSLQKTLSENQADNPLLKDLDRVVVHSVWEKQHRYQVSVDGEVTSPGEYVLAKGMRVADLIFAAGNVADRAYLKKAELTRYDVIDGEARVSQHIDVNLDRALSGDPQANVLLQPYDHLYVRVVTNWRSTAHVSIEGEVLFPGQYPINEGERLSSLIERAGGFADTAYLEAAVFTRDSIKKDQQKKLKTTAKQVKNEITRLESSAAALSNPKALAQRQASIAAAKNILEKMKSAQANGRLVINLMDADALKHGHQDLILHDGDRLYVPRRSDEILVMGQVYNSMAMLYQQGLDVDDYIDRSGGLTRMADADHIYVIHANGLVEAAQGSWFSRRTRVGPGDAIVAPEDLEKLNLLSTALDWTQVLYQLGVALASMKTIGVF